MKLRNGFVTNSSSSSYIIVIDANAGKDGLIKEMEEIFEKHKTVFVRELQLLLDDVVRYSDGKFEDWYEEDDVEMKMFKVKDNVEDLTKVFITELVDYLEKELYTDSPIADGIFVGLAECSNEDEGIIRQFLYSQGYNIEGKSIKLL